VGLAFAHPSSTPDRESSYERLEFLGDSVLGFSVATELFDTYPEMSEGALSRIRADVVSRRSCARIGRVLGLDKTLAERLADGETLAESTNVIAAVLEAVLGVLYLDLGIEAIRGPIAQAFAGIAEESRESGPDSKTQLQEALARRSLSAAYTLLDTQGPPHDRRFRCAVVVEGEVMGVGEGRSKKDAEQIAAAEALQKLAEE
jgi:ribonuclease III